MFWLNTKRIFKSGLQNFFRNGFVSLSSVLVMFITIFIIVSLILLRGFLNYSLLNIKNKVDVTVYFVTTANESDILSLEKSIEALPEVESVAYTSSDQALANFEAKHQSDSLTLAALDELGTNPLGASLDIKAKDPSQYAGIATFLNGTSNELLSSDGSPIIDTVDYAQNKLVIDRLTSIINSANMIGLWLAILFTLISIAVSFNTIRLTIFMAKDEISVMRLVGASNKYVKGPFVVSGLFCGLISAFLVLVFFAIVTFSINRYYGVYFVGYNVFQYYMSDFFKILGIACSAGMALGAVASYLAVRKYLKE